MKKVQSFVLWFSLLLGVGTAITVFAEEKVINSEWIFELAAEDKGCHAGDAVEVKYNASDITIIYDENVCTYEDFKIKEEFQDKIELQSFYKVPGEGKIDAAFIVLEDSAELERFATIYFTVKSDTEAVTSCALQLTMKREMDLVETDELYNSTEDIFAVTEELSELGDVNQDGMIDLIDAVYILLAHNEQKRLTETQNKAADVNQDGSVNLVEALQIMKYFNGEIISVEAGTDD